MAVLPLLETFLLGHELARSNSTGTHVNMRCVWCGGSKTDEDEVSLGVKVDVEEGEAVLCHCFRASCLAGYALKTDLLVSKFNCVDQAVINELAMHNLTISSTFDSDYREKVKKEHTLINMKTGINNRKLKYINERLGLSLDRKDLKKLKIQLSINEYIKINGIHDTGASVMKLDKLDRTGIGFVSAFGDYLIVRDFSAKMKKGRYVNLNTRNAKIASDATKLYILPTTIELLSPLPTVLHMAEGIFSILGAYYNTSINRDYDGNEIFAANCGTGFKQTISTIVKEYGITDMIIIIYSDSEVKIKFYEKLYKQIKDELNVVEMKVVWNTSHDDFGHSSDDISVDIKTIHSEDEMEGVIRI